MEEVGIICKECQTKNPVTALLGRVERAYSKNRHLWCHCLKCPSIISLFIQSGAVIEAEAQEGVLQMGEKPMRTTKQEVAGLVATDHEFGYSVEYTGKKWDYIVDR